MTHAVLGDGDLCPQNPDHGRMYFVGADRRTQWCPHSGHRGNARYEYDGVTPAREAAKRGKP